MIGLCLDDVGYVDIYLFTCGECGLSSVGSWTCSKE